MELTVLNNEQVLYIDNFEKYKEELASQLKKYQGYVLVDTKSAKEDRAELNKLKDFLENRRKDVKKGVERLYKDTFEPQMKELVAMIDECSKKIDAQIKVEEEKFKAQRQKEIDELVDNTIGLTAYTRIVARETKSGYGATLKWLNKSCSIEQIKHDLENYEYNLKNEIRNETTITFKLNNIEKDELISYLNKNGYEWEEL